jgi:hypothetical protein
MHGWRGQDPDDGKPHATLFGLNHCRQLTGHEAAAADLIRVGRCSMVVLGTVLQHYFASPVEESAVTF